VSAAALTIGAKERGTLHWLMVRRLFILGQDPPELARSEGVSLDQLAKEFAEDLNLMADLGWEVEDDRKTFDLTMPPDDLASAIKRLRRDARRAPCEAVRERDSEDADKDCWERFRAAVDTCEELLDLLDSAVASSPPSLSRPTGCWPSAARCRCPKASPRTSCVTPSPRSWLPSARTRSR